MSSSKLFVLEFSQVKILPPWTSGPTTTSGWPLGGCVGLGGPVLSCLLTVAKVTPAWWKAAVTELKASQVLSSASCSHLQSPAVTGSNHQQVFSCFSLSLSSSLLLPFSVTVSFYLFWGSVAHESNFWALFPHPVQCDSSGLYEVITAFCLIIWGTPSQ